jgi:phenylalanine-4-hydroxylase
VKAVFCFPVAAERPEEAPAGTLEKQTGEQKLVMKSGKWLL